MLDQKRDLFRKESLERLSSPEQLDQLMQVVGPKSWLPLTALGALTFLALVWSTVGRIPITVTGQGVLIYPHKVVSVQSESSGQVVTMNLEAGDTVKEGDVIATLQPDPELEKQLQEEQNKLAELQAQSQEASSLQGQRTTQEASSTAQQRQTLLERLRNAQDLTPVLRDSSLEALRENRRNLEQRLQALQTLLPILQDRLEKRQEILAEGAISGDLVLQAQQEYLSTLATYADAQSQLKQLDVQEADAERQYLANLTTISELQAQLRELETQATSFAQQNLESTNSRANQIQAVKQNIAILEAKLQNSSEIQSEFDGVVVEVAAVPGQLVSAGSNVATINVETDSNQLSSVAYFTIQDGKQIEPGMEIQVTPSTVKRERFGGILGSVTTVSSFPVTPQGATVLIGNEDTAQSLIANGHTIEVFAQLEADPETYSGYAWSSSKGPEQKFSAATTTIVRVKVGERSPISYVIPLLKSLTGN
jgi:HlyD family secretion protein